MTRGEFDTLDIVASPLFALGALTDNNIIDAPTVMGWNPADIIWQAGAHTEVTWATLLSIIALGFVIYTNKPSVSVYGGVQAWMVITTVGLVLAPPFVPIVEQFITHNQLVGFLAFSLQSSGYAVISWLG